jgi:aryl-alcohol dehydrogenase-like predicted oxidoreductase
VAPIQRRQPGLAPTLDQVTPRIATQRHKQSDGFATLGRLDVFAAGNQGQIPAGMLPRQERYWTEDAFATVAELAPLAEQAGMSLAHMAVAWVLAHPAVTSPIIGASRPEQLEDSLRAAATPLPADLKRKLDELTQRYRMGDSPRQVSAPVEAA